MFAPESGFAVDLTAIITMKAINSRLMNSKKIEGPDGTYFYNVWKENDSSIFDCKYGNKPHTIGMV